MNLLCEVSRSGRRVVTISFGAFPEPASLPAGLRRAQPAALPEVSELDVVRHFTQLSLRNYSVDANFYPLGSCTMKYNPKAADAIASQPGLLSAHPLQALLPGAAAACRGPLQVIGHLQELLAEITGMAAVTTQPLAGAHGELTGIMLIAAWHRAHGSKKKYVIVPDSSHGTNPASAAMAGYGIITIPTAADGFMDLARYREKLTDEVAAVMMTSPDTLGLFNPRIREIADLAHAAGALMYYDGANLNAILGKVRPGDVGFDVVHINLHKTFATPHGGGGPGAGPVGVVEKLIPYLPLPRVVRAKDVAVGFTISTEAPESIGAVSPFFGNFGILVRAYAYILMLGKEGLIDATEKAVLNANYIRQKLKDVYHLPYDRTCMHECVFSAKQQLAHGVHAIDIAKYLIDRGYHPPTVYFPLIVPEAIMIEPTETESKETLDAFIAVMRDAAATAVADPDALHHAPTTRCVTRLDETKAARELRVNHVP
ncbi:MAG TPA: aminomethyl-transferring glycine dehydrogenase subunit GcvPB [bacterium]|nr:aminomethyl-transferring glycine dehydrogenase subunit GcvPB [bacterium]